MVEVEPALVARMDQMVQATQAHAPLTIETIVNLAVDSFCEGAGF